MMMSGFLVWITLCIGWPLCAWLHVIRIERGFGCRLWRWLRGQYRVLRGPCPQLWLHFTPLGSEIFSFFFTWTTDLWYFLEEFSFSAPCPTSAELYRSQRWQKWQLSQWVCLSSLIKYRISKFPIVFNESVRPVCYRSLLHDEFILQVFDWLMVLVIISFIHAHWKFGRFHPLRLNCRSTCERFLHCTPTFWAQSFLI